jgi:hypothetical protein
VSNLIFDPAYPIDRIDIMGFNASDGIGIGALLKRQRRDTQVEVHTSFCCLGDLGVEQNKKCGRLLVAWIDTADDRHDLVRIAENIDASSGAYPDIHVRGGCFRSLTKGLRDSHLSVGECFPYVEFYREFCLNSAFEDPKEVDSVRRLNQLLDPDCEPRKKSEDIFFLGDLLGGIEDFNPRTFQKNARRLVSDLALNLEFPTWTSSYVAAFFEYVERAECDVYQKLNGTKPYRAPGIYVIPDPKLHPLLFTLDRSPRKSKLPGKLKLKPNQLIILAPMATEYGAKNYEIWAADPDILKMAVDDLKKVGLYSHGYGIAPDKIAKAIPVLGEIAY